MIYDLIELFSSHSSLDEFIQAAQDLGVPVTRAGLGVLARVTGVRQGDIEEALWRARTFPEEELRCILGIPERLSVSLRGKDYALFLLGIYGKIVTPFCTDKVARLVREHTVAFAVSGEAPLTRGEMTIAPGVIMRVIPVLGDSIHDPYIETIVVAFNIPAGQASYCWAYAREYLPRFLTFTPGKEVFLRFHASRRADAPRV